MKSLLNPKTLLGMLAAAALLLAGLVLILLLPAPVGFPSSGAAVAMTVIPAPSSTPTPQVVAPTPDLGAPATPTLAPGQIGVGLYVQITGTGGDGLRVRQEPGLNATSLFLGYDAEAFQVIEGPRQADGYTWWKLSAPYDVNRSGWAAENYLVVIPTP